MKLTCSWGFQTTTPVNAAHLDAVLGLLPLQGLLMGDPAHRPPVPSPFSAKRSSRFARLRGAAGGERQRSGHENSLLVPCSAASVLWPTMRRVVARGTASSTGKRKSEYLACVFGCFVFVCFFLSAPASEYLLHRSGGDWCCSSTAWSEISLHFSKPCQTRSQPPSDWKQTCEDDSAALFPH